jgi:hypothetical protein
MPPSSLEAHRARPSARQAGEPIGPLPDLPDGHGGLHSRFPTMAPLVRNGLPRFPSLGRLPLLASGGLDINARRYVFPPLAEGLAPELAPAPPGSLAPASTRPPSPPPERLVSPWQPHPHDKLIHMETAIQPTTTARTSSYPGSSEAPRHRSLHDVGRLADGRPGERHKPGSRVAQSRRQWERAVAVSLEEQALLIGA